MLAFRLVFRSSHLSLFNARTHLFLSSPIFLTNVFVALVRVDMHIVSAVCHNSFHELDAANVLMKETMRGSFCMPVEKKTIDFT